MVRASSPQQLPDPRQRGLAHPVEPEHPLGQERHGVEGELQGDARVQGAARAGDGPGWEVELARPSGAKPGALRVILPEG